MSDYASIVERTRRSFSAVARLESALERDPGNPGLQVNLAAAKKRAEQSKARLFAISENLHVEVCNYRLLPEATEHFTVSGVAGSLLAYQNLFSQIYDAKVNRPKAKAQLSRGSARESALDLAYTYSGSLGVVLLAQSERDFFSGRLDGAIDALFDVLQIESQEHARQAIQELGAAVVRRAREWSETNLVGGFATDIRWNRSDGRQLGEIIERRRMERLVDVLNRTSDERVKDVLVEGVLLGGDLESKSFHLVVPNGESYRGRQAEDFRSEGPLTLGHRYKAVVREKKKVYYATEHETVIHELVSLAKFP